MIFDYLLRDRISYYSIGMLVFSILHLILGFHYFYKEWFHYKDGEANDNKVAYDDNRVTFFAEYDRCNPVTQAAATINFLKYLRSKFFFLFLERNPKMAKEIGKIIKNMEKKKVVEEGAKPDDDNSLQTEAEGIKQGLDIYANQNLELKEYGK